MIVGVIRRKPVLTHASIVCEGMLASVNSVNSDDDVNSWLVSHMTVTSVCFSDHHLITCFLAASRYTASHDDVYSSYRPIRTLDTAAFCRDILYSKLYNCTTSDEQREEGKDGEGRRQETKKGRGGRTFTRQISSECVHYVSASGGQKPQFFGKF